MCQNLPMIAALRIVAAMSFAIRRFAAALAALLFAMMVGYVAGEIAGQRARANLENGLAADARLRQALLASELERFELL
ncbi:hypothetical protein, partial [Clostridium perfringens]